MSAPHETPIPGAAADLADRLAAMIPVLETGRLRLRAPRLTDFPVWADIVCSARGAHMMGPMTRDAAWDDFARLTVTWLLRGHGGWVVETREASDRVGVVLIGFEPGDQEPELGFALGADHEGKGYASEAATAARDHARDTLRLPSLVSYVDPANTRSLAVLHRLGARRDPAAEAAVDHGCHVYRHFGPEIAA